MRLSSKLVNGIILILIAVSALSGLYIFIFQRSSSLALDLEGPEEVLSGAPFDLKVNFSNNSGAVLSDVRLSVILPEGFAFFGQNEEKNIVNKFLGNVGAGSLIQESYQIIAFASAGESKEIKAAINYAPASLGARFEKNSVKGVVIRSSGVEVVLSVPEQVTSGEEFPIEAVYRNIADEDFNDLELKLEYPPSFSFGSASLRPDSGNNIWRLGALRKNSEGRFTIKGILIGGEGDAFEFKSELDRRAAGNTYLVNRASAKTMIGSSPLIFSIHLNSINSGGAEYVASPGEVLSYTVSYLNNQEAALNNLVIRAQLAGEMFDLSSVQSGGLWRSADNTLIWNSENTPQLALLASGSAGVVNFQVRVKEAYPAKRFSDKNFVLKITGEAAADSKILSKALLGTKVAGAVSVDAKAYFRDADSGFLNRGPMPPKVGQPTNFTIHWLLKSSAVDFSQVEVRGILGNNVKMVGSAKVSVGTVSYDESSREAVWRLDRLLANQGAIGAPVEAVFQVEATPAAESAGNYLPLIGATGVTAVDDFTGKTAISNDAPLTTALSDDSTIGQQGGVVQP